MRRPLDMAAVEEPPAKKLCVEHEVVGQPDLPADDDDDFYDTAPVNPSSTSPAVERPLSIASVTSPAASATIPSLEIPGLGLLSASPDKEPAQTAPPPSVPAAQGDKVYEESGADIPTRDGEAEDEAKAEFLRVGEANKGDQNAEWQLDSSASDSSSDTSSDDSSDDSSEDEGLLLGPEEQARLLMLEEEGEPGTGAAAKIKSTHEVEETFEKPKITVTPEMKITDLGRVESVVGNMVLIKAKVENTYQVLEAGSALCLADRTVVGQVSDLLGKIDEPRYSFGFNEASEISALGIEKGTTIYYVDDHSKFVFTEPLKKQKFTDASNLYDEEADDVEFSDDEKEAEFKRQKKLEKKARAGQSHPTTDTPAVPAKSEYQSGGLNYSDDEDFGMYKPLVRPDHFEDIVGAGAPLEDRSHVRRGNPRPARGFRGRGGGGGSAGRDRGGGRGRGDRFPRGRHQEHNRRDNRHKQNSPQATRSPRPSKSPSQRRRGPPERPRSAAPPAQDISASATANVQATSFNQGLWSYPNASNPQSGPNQYPAANAYSFTNPTPTPTLPAGAHVNPSFPAAQVPPQDQTTYAQQASLMAWAQYFSAMQRTQQQTAPVANSNNAQPADPRTAAAILQQSLDYLNRANKPPGSS